VARLAALGFDDALRLDLDDPASIDAALGELLAATGGTLDALVNNAGFGVPGAIEDLPRDAWRRQFETNVFGLAELTAKCVPVMRRQGRGRIVMISSILGVVPMPMRGAYNASKFALEGLAGTLRLELRGSGIEVVSVNPGAIESRFREHAVAEARRTLVPEKSVHAERYAALEARNSTPGGKLPGSLPSEAVAKRVVHALQSRRPRIRYYVTAHARALAMLAHVLPARWMDAILARL
jgi:NAD(P)-dependent dehydrogenase (short-subunit alcohol dehydrogenase family)